MTAPDQCCPEELPYFGPLQKLPASFLTSHLCFSRVPGQPRTYVQDGIRREAQSVACMLKEPATHVFSLPSEGNESGIEDAFTEVCKGISDDRSFIKAQMQTTGRFQVETY